MLPTTTRPHPYNQGIEYHSCKRKHHYASDCTSTRCEDCNTTLTRRTPSPHCRSSQWQQQTPSTQQQLSHQLTTNHNYRNNHSHGSSGNDRNYCARFHSTDRSHRNHSRDRQSRSRDRLNSNHRDRQSKKQALPSKCLPTLCSRKSALLFPADFLSFMNNVAAEISMYI